MLQIYKFKPKYNLYTQTNHVHIDLGKTYAEINSCNSATLKTELCCSSSVDAHHTKQLEFGLQYSQQVDTGLKLVALFTCSFHSEKKEEQ